MLSETHRPYRTAEGAAALLSAPQFNNRRDIPEIAVLRAQWGNVLSAILIAVQSPEVTDAASGEVAPGSR